VARDQVQPPAVRSLAQVGDLDRVGQDVVAVIAQQRVGVEQHRADTTHHHQVVGQRPRQAGLQRQPGKKRQRGDPDLGHHACGAYQHALALVCEGVGCRRVDIGHGVEQQQHQAHLVHLAAAQPHGQAVGHLVGDLQQREAQGQHPQVVGRQQLIAEVVAQFVPARRQQQQRWQHHPQPGQHQRPARQRRCPARHPLQHAVGVPERKAQRQGVEHLAHEALALVLLAALEKLGHVGRGVQAQQVGRVQLAQQVHDLVLGGRVVLQVGQQLVPDRLQAVQAVQPLEHPPGRRVETMLAAGHPIFDRIPDPAAVDMAVHAHVATQAR